MKDVAFPFRNIIAIFYYDKKFSPSLSYWHLFLQKMVYETLVCKKRLLAKNEKLNAIICTETFMDDLLSMKLSFQNVFLFPRRHLYLIRILWIIEKHKYDKSAELRRIKSLWIGEWMDLLSPSQQNDFPIYIKPIKTNQRVLFTWADGWPCWKK